MTQKMDDRIQKMFRGDLLFAWTFVAVLWAAVVFVFFSVSALIDDATIRAVLLIGGGLVLFFNTAAIFAMGRHYAHEKQFIYGLDIRHLDEMRRMRGK